MNRLPTEVHTYLESHTTLALSTRDGEGHPAVAPLFYALLPQGDLVFISSPHTEHVRNVAHHPLVALAVYREGQEWQRIQGLQARGWAYELPPEMHREAWDAYVQKFPFLRNLFDTAVPSVQQLRAALADARWYAIRLTWVRIIDNRVAFGHKKEWQRSEEGSWVQIR